MLDHSAKVGASHTASLTPLPLTSPSPQRCGEEGLLQAAALVPVAKTGESEDVWTRARPQCDGKVFAELRYGVVAHTRENSVKYYAVVWLEIWAQFQPNP